MTPPAWLLVAAAVLALAAGWCIRGEAALALMAPPERPERPDRPERLEHPERPDHQHPKHPDDQDPLRTVVADLPRYLSVLLLLRAICEVFAAVLVTAAFVRWFGDDWRAVFAALAVMIALRYALTGVRPQGSAVGPRVERTAARTAAFLFPLTRLLGPLPRLLVAVGNVMPPRRRQPPPDPEGPEARSELRGLVDYLERNTGIEPGERAMVRSVFELGDTIAREVMVPRTDMVFIENDRTVEQALSLALRSGFSRIPVVGENEDDVVGIAYLKDIVAWSKDHPGAEATEKVATVIRPASYVPDSKPVDELLRQMQAQRNHVAIVIDEYGGTAGLVTIEDILEEIVGEITDEYDNELPPVEWLPDGSARVTSRLSVTELEELFGVRVDDEDVETVAGLLAHQLGRVPIAGSTATVRGLRLTAENLTGRRNKIGTVLVERDESTQS
jgi:CBS domain containing-hemolysin-like protein